MKFNKRGPKGERMVLFIDLKRAFDSINRTHLIEVLEKCLKTKGELELLEKLLYP